MVSATSLWCFTQGPVSGAELPNELHQLWRARDGLHRPQNNRRHNADVLHPQGRQIVDEVHQIGGRRIFDVAARGFIALDSVAEINVG